MLFRSKNIDLLIANYHEIIAEYSEIAIIDDLIRLSQQGIRFGPTEWKGISYFKTAVIRAYRTEMSNLIGQLDVVSGRC